MLKRIINKIHIETTKMLLKVTNGKKIIIGKHLSFRKRLNIRISSNGNLNIGNNVFFNNDCSINCVGNIVIGDHCLFGENVKLYDHGHNYADSNTPIQKQGLKVGTINIGKNCWIGSNVVILPNVKIGDNVIIGANCLIYKSIPDNMIVKCNSGVIIERNQNYI